MLKHAFRQQEQGTPERAWGLIVPESDFVEYQCPGLAISRAYRRCPFFGKKMDNCIYL